MTDIRMHLILSVIWLLKVVVANPDEGLKITDLSQCNFQIEQVGCFNDNVAKRVLKEQVINSRDKTSNVYTEPNLNRNWKNYPHFLSNFVCECAKRVVEENRGQYFGVQFYAECWSGAKDQGNSQDSLLDQYGEEDKNCIDADYKPYTGDQKSCGVYSGKQSANYIYRVVKYSEKVCPQNFEAVGCFHDNHIDPRPLSQYIMNERDVSLPNWNGHVIEWNNWENYMPELICRCSMVARKNNFRYFGIQFYGECWAGNDTESISKDGPGKPDDCLVKLGMPPYGMNCQAKEEYEKKHACHSQLCVGKQMTNHVYELKQGPLTCSSNPCKPTEVCRPNGPTKHDCIPQEQFMTK